MNEWRDARLADLVRFRNGKSTVGLEPGNYPIYGSNGIIGSGARHMYENAIILGRVGAYCGSVEYCPDKFWATDNTIVVEPLEKHLDIAFAAYMLRLANLNRYAGGSAQPLLTQTNLKGLSFLVPPLGTQRRIASILRAYDDMIEVNRQRIAVLEEMARGLFDEWFVRFRFPGHSSVPILDTPDGPIPDGWSFATLADIATNVRSSFNEQLHGDLPLLDLSRIPRRSSLITAFGQPDELTTSRLIAQANDVMFAAIRPNLYKVVAAPTELVTNVSVHIIRSLGEMPQCYVWGCLFRDYAVAWASQHANGTKMPTISWGTLGKFPVLVPSRPVVERYAIVVSSMLEAISITTLAHQKLSASRDLLLPRLISGQLCLTQVERELEAA